MHSPLLGIDNEFQKLEDATGVERTHSRYTLEVAMLVAVIVLFLLGTRQWDSNPTPQRLTQSL